MLHHVLEDRVGGQGEQLFVEGNIGIEPGFAVVVFQGIAHVHQGQAQLADFLAADRLCDQTDNERLKGVAQLQHVFEAGTGDCTVMALAVAELRVEYDYAFAWHRAYEAKGFQNDHRFAQARAADAQLFGQFALSWQHLTGAPLTPGQRGPKFFYH
ncbi:hypothetical protein D3C81_1550140 [compost metagenome]